MCSTKDKDYDPFRGLIILNVLNSKMKTFNEVLLCNLHKKPQKICLTHLNYEQNKIISITYEELFNNINAIAFLFNKKKVKQERIVLLFNTGFPFVNGFLGCLFSKNIAVPINPPVNDNSEDRLLNIIKDCTPRIILTENKILKALKQNEKIKVLYNNKDIKIITLDQLEIKNTNAISLATSENNIAFLQYTSGSTGNPKGVIISQKNLYYNSQYIAHSFKLDDKDTSITWLPNFHDMGLIDGLLQPLFTGFHGYFMSPKAFIRRPIRWLEAISKYKATHSGGPNFGYDLCVSHIPNNALANLNLSFWKSAYNGAEPIRLETINRFIEKFSTCGFQSSSFYPCYGLAESTLMVTGDTTENKITTFSNDLRKVNYVSSGIPRLKTQIQIVKPESTTILPSYQVGEILVNSPSNAIGYWNNQLNSRSTFKVKLPNQEGYWLRTGDLGFLDSTGKLYVTDRLKDLIIMDGRNYFPSEIESIIENTIELIKKNNTIVFSILINAKEVVVAITKLRTFKSFDYHDIALLIHSNVIEKSGLKIDVICFLKNCTIPKTSSGKLQRNLCKDLFLANKLTLAEKIILSKDVVTDIAFLFEM